LYPFGVAGNSDPDWLLGRVQQQLTGCGDAVDFGEPRHFSVKSLAYAPSLARAGQCRASEPCGGLVLD
jgi:hypothetical protein